MSESLIKRLRTQPPVHGPSSSTQILREEAASEIEGLCFYLEQVLQAVLNLYGPDGADKVIDHVLAARKARAMNDEIDKLEEIFGAITPDHGAK